MSAPSTPQLGVAKIRVVKRDGTTEPYDGYEIARSIEAAARGLDASVTRTTQLRSELEITLFDKITTEQLDEAVIQVALQNVKDDPAYDTIAARLLVKTLYKKVLGETHDLFGDSSPETIQALHREHFAATSSAASSWVCWTPGSPVRAVCSTWTGWPAPSTLPATTCCTTSARRPSARAT